MFLTQPPVRKVTLEVRARSTDKYMADTLSVRVIANEDGIRLGHVVATVGEEAKTAIQNARSISTMLLLHEVVEEGAASKLKRPRARE